MVTFLTIKNSNPSSQSDPSDSSNIEAGQHLQLLRCMHSAPLVPESALVTLEKMGELGNLSSLCAGRTCPLKKFSLQLRVTWDSIGNHYGAHTSPFNRWLALSYRIRLC